MPPTEWQSRIALTLIPDLGPVRIRALIAHYGSAGAIFREPVSHLEKLGLTGRILCAWTGSTRLLTRASVELEYITNKGISPRWFTEEDFPERLNRCHDGPVILYTLGEKELEPCRALSVVGTRKATDYGRIHCPKLIRELSRLCPDVVIISGLAYGIDVMAHRAALENGLKTYAVLGHGLSTLYPARHREIAQEIARQGCLISDFDSSMGPERNHFLRRNRIIAGLSDATVVVESALKGGALVTADIAFSYDRQVMVFPGRAGDLMSRGCNSLIKDHTASLIEDAEDLVRLLEWTQDLKEKKTADSPRQGALFRQDLSEGEQELLRILREFPGSDPSALSRRSGLPVHEVLSLLLTLELKEYVRCAPGRRYLLLD